MDTYLSNDCSGEALTRGSYIASLKATAVANKYEATILKVILSFSQYELNLMDWEEPLEPWVEYDLE